MPTCSECGIKYPVGELLCPDDGQMLFERVATADELASEAIPLNGHDVQEVDQDRIVTIQEAYALESRHSEPSESGSDVRLVLVYYNGVQFDKDSVAEYSIPFSVLDDHPALIGRSDDRRVPPIVADVDLTEIPRVIHTKDQQSLVSRQQAWFYKAGNSISLRAGKGAPTFVMHDPSSRKAKRIVPHKHEELKKGDIIIFGYPDKKTSARFIVLF